MTLPLPAAQRAACSPAPAACGACWTAQLPGELPFHPFPEQERGDTLLPCAALHRPLILPPLMLISEVVHRSSLICYPGGVSFRASDRETADGIRASRALREHPQLQKAAGCAQQVPMEAVSYTLLSVPAAFVPRTAVPSTHTPLPWSPSLTCIPAHERLLVHVHTCMPAPDPAWWERDSGNGNGNVCSLLPVPQFPHQVTRTQDA